ncbi:hypothetical protein [Streptomyces sp. MUM 178J]|uniref:hypothetical protein n=1 Tax=Streptomyces sp. MUM 178J TaxID=2791991 RepID=UPI001F040B04|nr:hypothetical protein [Streptomyces sp. MUM 178J]WRQ81299.1 hypothetical protein I3F59_019180 [Streptomyces sp. MUM 178J]
MHPVRRRSFVRTAVVTVALGGALTAPVCAFAADAPHPGDLAGHAPEAAPVRVVTIRDAAYGGAGEPVAGATAARAGMAGISAGRDTATTIAAAGGLASIGAAGLGFAMMRRGRTDG